MWSGKCEELLLLTLKVVPQLNINFKCEIYLVCSPIMFYFELYMVTKYKRMNKTATLYCVILITSTYSKVCCRCTLAINTTVRKTTGKIMGFERC